MAEGSVVHLKRLLMDGALLMIPSAGEDQAPGSYRKVPLFT